MPEQMSQLAKIFVFLIVLSMTPVRSQAAAQECMTNWSASEFKSFGDVQTEVKKRFGEVRILRVALCNPGYNPYFQVVIISEHGEVRRVQVAAAN